MLQSSVSVVTARLFGAKVWLESSVKMGATNSVRAERSYVACKILKFR